MKEEEEVGLSTFLKPKNSLFELLTGRAGSKCLANNPDLIFLPSVGKNMSLPRLCRENQTRALSTLGLFKMKAVALVLRTAAIKLPVPLGQQLTLSNQ